MQEIGRAVERVDVPGVALVGTFDMPALFHQEAISGAGARQLLEEGFFRALVGVADEIARPLHRDLQVLDFAEVALQTAAGLERGRDHYVHQGGADHEDLGRGTRGSVDARPTARKSNAATFTGWR